MYDAYAKTKEKMLVIKNKGLCWIVREKKLCYFHIPKCASSAIRESAEYEYCHADDVPDDFFVFTVLRNPYQRFYSAYAEAMKREDILSNQIPFPQSDRDIMDTIDLLETGVYEPHFVPQYKFLEGYEHRIDEFVLFANVGMAISKIYKDREIPNNFVNKNISDPSTKQHIRNIVRSSKQVGDRITKIYQRDFDLIRIKINKQAVFEL